MSVFNQISAALTGNTNNRVEDALGRFSAAMQRIASASERMADDTEQVASASERLADLNAQRLGVAPAKAFTVRIENVGGEIIISSPADLAALLAPLPAVPCEEGTNESEQCGAPTSSGKSCRLRKPCRHHSS